MKKKKYSILIWLFFAISLVGFLVETIGIALDSNLLCSVGFLVGFVFAVFWFIFCDEVRILNKEEKDDKE